MIERNGSTVGRRLGQCSLYDPTLDLAVEDVDGTLAGYALFWFDPVTLVGLLEPMRVEDDYQRRGLARVLLTNGLDRLARKGARRLKVGFETDPARSLYLSAGFRADISRSTADAARSPRTVLTHGRRPRPFATVTRGPRPRQTGSCSLCPPPTGASTLPVRCPRRQRWASAPNACPGGPSRSRPKTRSAHSVALTLGRVDLEVVAEVMDRDRPASHRVEKCLVGRFAVPDPTSRRVAAK